MKLLELTLPTPAENLALDEALLESAESAGQGQEVLRLWEAPSPMVVVGRASRMEEEVAVEACRQRGIPIFRRHSGGAAIVAGPGCLMYAVVLSYDLRPQLRMIDEAHRFVLDTICQGVRQLAPMAQRKGISDLTIDERLKFSGNSLRCCRTHLLYHGTLLYDFPLELIAQCLKQPPRQPEYRQQRSHDAFVANLDVAVKPLRNAIVQAWGCEDSLLDTWPRTLTARLVDEKYSTEDWNYGR